MLGVGGSLDSLKVTEDSYGHQVDPRRWTIVWTAALGLMYSLHWTCGQKRCWDSGGYLQISCGGGRLPYGQHSAR